MNILVLKSLLFGIMTTALFFVGALAFIAFIAWINLSPGVWLFGILFIILTFIAASWYYDIKTTRRD